jgi:hypothetical protein
MNTNTINRLKSAAPSIEKFRNLKPTEQQWLEPLLTKTAKTALAILDTIESSPLTYEAIKFTIAAIMSIVRYS